MRDVALTDPDVHVLALSPHLDDVLFSAAAVVQSRPVEVWTVFAGAPEPAVTTDWDRACGFTDSDETLAARRTEDLLAFEGTNATVRHLPLLDGPYSDPGRRRTDLGLLAAVLGAWWDEHPAGLVIVPAGAGARVAPAFWERLRRHSDADLLAPPAGDGAVRTGRPAPGAPHPTKRLVNLGKTTVRRLMHADYQRRRAAARRRGLAVNNDHLAVRDLALHLAAERWQRGDRAAVALYEDLPYLWAEPADAAVAEVARTHQLRASAVVLPIDVDDKFTRIQHYASQVDVMDPVEHRLSKPGHLPTTERYWLLEPATHQPAHEGAPS
ncbi:hypothetical protein ACQB6R_01765 [Propionibacteriaceae bacterium G1746]